MFIGFLSHAVSKGITLSNSVDEQSINQRYVVFSGFYLLIDLGSISLI